MEFATSVVKSFINFFHFISFVQKKSVDDDKITDTFSQSDKAEVKNLLLA